MGYQFQSVASVSTFLIDDLDIDYAQFGLLIGLYMFPGIALAYPGGLLGRRFGDKQVVVVALALMASGGSIIGSSESYPLALAGRTLCGVGAVLLNVLLAKMVADWFVGKEIVTAMAILVTSWPLGISLALISLGPLAAASSWLLAMHLTAIACLLGLVLVVVFYQTPSATSNGQKTNSTVFKLSRQEILLVTLAGIIWALFNVSLIIVPSFAPAFLTSAGYSIVTAGSLVSVATWIVIPSIPLGGYLAERLKRPNIFMVSCFLGIGIAICLVPYWQYPLILFLVIGLVFGPPAGIIMSLPVEVLLPENRAAGMGIYYTCYYAGMAALCPLAGLSRDLTQNPAAPLFFGGAVIFITISILGLFRTLQRRMCGADIQ
jgi:predicted MFS family arabinose efflux permease